MSKDFMAELSKHYTIRDPEGVRKFLEKHQELVPTLKEAVPEIKKFFPTEERKAARCA